MASALTSNKYTVTKGEISTYFPCDGSNWTRFCSEQGIPSNVSQVDLATAFQTLKDATPVRGQANTPNAIYRATEEFKNKLIAYTNAFVQKKPLKKKKQAFVESQLNITKDKCDDILKIHGQAVFARKRFPGLMEDLTEELQTLTPDVKSVLKFYNGRFRLIGITLKKMALSSEELGETEFAATAKDVIEQLKQLGSNEANRLAQKSDQATGDALFALMKEMLPKQVDVCNHADLLGRGRSRPVRSQVNGIGRKISGQHEHRSNEPINQATSMSIGLKQMIRGKGSRPSVDKNGDPVYWC